MALEVESIAFKSSANNSSLLMQKSMYKIWKIWWLEASEPYQAKDFV